LLGAQPIDHVGVNWQTAPGDLLYVEDRRLFQLTSTFVSFRNITLEPEEINIATLMVLHPDGYFNGKENYKLNIELVDISTNELIGGLGYNIIKPECDNLKHFCNTRYYNR
jgi:hypothetical protein